MSERLSNERPGLFLLIRWREKKIALTSDVEAMFSQVEVANDDRFLWRGTRQEGEFDQYESPVVIFGRKSSSSVAAHCYRRTATTFASSNADVMSAVNEDTYVDDIITGKDEEWDAIDRVKGVTETLLKGGFKLGPWTTNSREVLQKLPHEF